MILLTIGVFYISTRPFNNSKLTGEASIENSESYMSLAATCCPEILVAYNLQKLNCLYVNPAVAMVTGYSTEEVMEMPLGKLLTATSSTAVKKRAKKLLSSPGELSSPYHLSTCEVQVICKDGREKCLEASGHCMEDNKGELIFYGLLRGGNKNEELDKKYKDVFNTIEDGYYEVDLKGRLTFLNDAACRILGLNPEEYTSIEQLSLYKNPQRVFQKLKQVYKTGLSDGKYIVEINRRDGSPGLLEISIAPMKDKFSVIVGFRGIARDVTEREEAQKQLEYFSMHDKLTGLYNRTFFEEELRRLSRGRDYPITMISADLNGLKLINDTLGHDKGDLLLKAAADVLKLSLRGSDVLARVGGDEFTAILSNTDEATADKVLKRIRYNVKDFSDNNPDLYLSFSLGVATAHSSEVSNTELFKQADDSMYRDKFSPSTLTRNKIIKGMMDALAEKDYIADGHCKRLALLCREMGTRLSLSPRQHADLALLAQVHDLGKVAIPDIIIFKKGPLTENEWKIMKEHPEKGHRIALSSNYLTGVASLILKHHEHWNGDGYPSQIKGREIPIECRIFSIVDAYDAMTNKREYNIVKSPEEALEELKKCSGTQFDPELVNIFVDILEKRLK